MRSGPQEQAAANAVATATATAVATSALRDLRRATLGRSVRGNLRWAVRAVGWGSIVYLAFWTVILLLAALQSLAPLGTEAAGLVRRWGAPAGTALLALVLLLSVRTRVTPLWFDRRDLAHLANGAAPPRVVLAWPAWRAAVPALAWGSVLGVTLALVLPRLLGVAAPAAVLVLPALTLALLVLRWRAALAGGRDALGWGLAGLALAAAALAAGCASTGAHGCAVTASAPLAAALGAIEPPTAFAVAAVLALLVSALTVRTIAIASHELPPFVLRQSELLAELRAIATLRGLAAISATAPDPGARFAAGRARAALHGRRSAIGPRWRPAIPARGGATAAFAWLGVVRAWRASPWSLLVAPLVVFTVALNAAPNGPFGGAALVPSLALGWLAAQLYPGRAGWPGFAIDARARALATMLLVGMVVVVTSLGADTLRALLGWPPALDNWLLLPLGLAAAALVDLIGSRSADPRGTDVWLLTSLLIAAPGALLGWSGVEPGVAAPLTAGALGLVAWVRVLATPSLA